MGEGANTKAGQEGPASIDAYVAGFPEDVQAILEKIRVTIREAAPEAEETISYSIPTFRLSGLLVSFAAYKRHIGLYPAPAGNARFNKELAVYRSGKSSVKFPLDEPIPFDLIREIVRLRVKDNQKKAEARAKK